MSLFSQLKQITDLKDQAKKLQKELELEVVDAEKSGVKVTINGNQEIKKVEIIDQNLLGNKEKLENAIKDAVNESIKKVQMVMAKKMQTMEGLNIPGLK